MTLRSLAATAACVCALVLAQFSPSFADGMPDDEDDNFNPVPSVPAVPAPGVKAPPPVRVNPKPAKPAAPAAPVVQPATPPTPAPVPSAPVVAPPPAPAPVAPIAEPTPPAAVTTPSPVTVQPVPPAAEPAPAPVAPKPAPAASNGQKTIYEVLTVDVAISKKNPPSAVITVKGTARTGGWSKVELRPLQTFAPEVGMRSFTLVGQPPSGFATQVLSPVTATFTIDPLPADVKTIRVLSETNEIAQNFR
jgi:hypothetical protein